jgi:hypothetical protein
MRVVVASSCHVDSEAERGQILRSVVGDIDNVIDDRGRILIEPTCVTDTSPIEIDPNRPCVFITRVDSIRPSMRRKRQKRIRVTSRLDADASFCLDSAERACPNERAAPRKDPAGPG